MPTAPKKKAYSVLRGFNASYDPPGDAKPRSRYFTRQDAHLVPLIKPAKRRELIEAGCIAEYDSAEDLPLPAVQGSDTPAD
jgi:hypothetical protein